MITLRRMSLLDCWRVIPWRNACRANLRTPTDDTRWSQFKFYLRVIRNPFSPHYYRSVYRDGQMVGMVGVCNVEPGMKGEISLITDPALRGQGIGRQAVRLAKALAFYTLDLRYLWGEVYASNPAVSFWRGLVEPRWWREGMGWRDKQMVPVYRFQWRRP